MAFAGLAVLITRWPNAATALAVAGGLYLLWLGFASLRRAAGAAGNRQPATGNGIDAVSAGSTEASARGFRQGLTVNLLNPAITSFYVAVVPSFMPEAAPGWYFAPLAAAHIVIAFGCHAAWTLAFGRLRRAMAAPALARTLDAAAGLVLVALAIQVMARV